MTSHDPSPDEFSESYDDEDELVTCTSCGHPNLSYRNHCRRCGNRLHSTANLIPGVHLVEWTSTDGPRRQIPRQGFPTILAWLLGITALPGLWVGALTRSPVLLVVSGSLIGLAIYFLVRCRHVQEQVTSSQEQQNTHPCPFCNGPLNAWDDLCPSCGEVVAEDIDDAG